MNAMLLGLKIPKHDAIKRDPYESCVQVSTCTLRGVSLDSFIGSAKNAVGRKGRSAREKQGPLLLKLFISGSSDYWGL